MPIIGIDLGTTNSVIACFREDGPVIIPNRLGEHLTPSIVSIDENEQIYVGQIAKERQITHPQYTVDLFKRSMGTKRQFKLGDKVFLAEELAALVIRSLKEDAEVFCKESITSAVISVPAYFNDTQRKATERAAELAGLKVERLINEPTAASLAYGIHKRQSHTKFLVFDLGGGTFDVSILEQNDNVMEVRGVAGDNYLGGEDFTQVLVQLFVKHHGLQLEHINEQTRAMLRKQAEQAKQNFEANRVATMQLRIEDEVLKYTISLEEYEKQCQPLLRRLRKPIERALTDSAIKTKSIDTIVMVGGGTKLPIIRSFIGRLFGRVPAMQVDPDKAVAIGASIQAAMKTRAASIKEVVLTDVCPYTLGTNVSIEKPGGYFESGHFYPIIERNTVIPVSRTERLYTIADNQKQINVQILQGESRLCKDNIYLGEINVPVPKGPAGSEFVEIRYTYDINGLLEVEVKVISTGFEKRMIIEKNTTYMSKEQIEERFKELSNLKIHPRDKEENKLLLAKGARLYEEHVGALRLSIDKRLQAFENALELQDDRKIAEAAEEMKKLIETIEDRQLFE